MTGLNKTTVKTESDEESMMCLLGRLDMLPQLSLLVPQRRLLLPSHRTTRQNHHNRLIPLLLLIRRATRRSLVLLPLERSKLLAPLASLLDRRHPLRVVCLGFLARPEDVVLGYERVFECIAGLEGLAGGFEGGEFALRC